MKSSTFPSKTYRTSFLEKIEKISEFGFTSSELENIEFESMKSEQKIALRKSFSNMKKKVGGVVNFLLIIFSNSQKFF